MPRVSRGTTTGRHFFFSNEPGAQHSAFSVDRGDNNNDDDDRGVRTDPAAGCVINQWLSSASAANRHCSNKPRWRRGTRAAVRRLLPPPAAWHPLCVYLWANVCLLCVSMNTEHIHRMARYCCYHRFTFTWLPNSVLFLLVSYCPLVDGLQRPPSCYDSTDPLGVIAETHTVLLPGAALCSIMVSRRLEEEPTAKRANIL